MSNIFTPPTTTADVALGNLLTPALFNTSKQNFENYFATNIPTNPVVFVNTSTSITTNNQYVFCNNTTAITITLPAIPATGKNIWLKFVKTGVGTATTTLAANGSQTIGGAATQRLITQGSYFSFVGVPGTNDWIIVENFTNLAPTLFRIRKTSTQTISSGSQLVSFSSVITDPSSSYSTTNNRYTALFTGTYYFETNLFCTNPIGSPITRFLFQVTGVGGSGSNQFDNGISMNFTNVAVSGIVAYKTSSLIPLNAGESVSVVGSNDFSGTSFVIGTDGDKCNFTGRCLSV